MAGTVVETRELDSAFLGSGFGSGILLPNGCLQQIAAN
jgi:hypothetical protein